MNLADLDPSEWEAWERYILTVIQAFLFVDHVESEKRLHDMIVEDLAQRWSQSQGSWTQLWRRASGAPLMR